MVLRKISSKLAACLLAAAGVVLASGSARADCSVKYQGSKKIYKSVQSALAVAKPGVEVDLDVSGQCPEKLYIPRAMTVYLFGKERTAGEGVTLTPREPNRPLAFVEGALTLQGFTVNAGSGGAFSLLQADNGGTLSLVGSEVTSSTYSRLATAYNNSRLFVVNTSLTMTGEQDSVLEIDGSSELRVQGDGSQPDGPGGAMTKVSGAADSGLNCYIGGAVIVEAREDGAVEISGNTIGVRAQGCSLSFYNNTSSANGIVIKDNVKDGFHLYNSTAALNGVSISGNDRFGLNLWNSQLFVYGTRFASSGNADIWSGMRSTVALDGPAPGNQNSFPTLSDASFSCYADGRIYYQKDSVTQDISEIAAGNPGCLSTYE